MRKLQAVAALAIGVLALVGWSLQDTPGLSQPSAAADARPATGANASPAPARAGSRSAKPLFNTSYAPLPDNDVAPAEVLAMLKPRADRGDAPAACRLAATLIQCRALLEERPRLDQWLRQQEKGAESMAFDEAQLSALETKQLVARRAEQCGALPPGALAQGGDYLYRAARAGIPQAQLRYAQGKMFGLAADVFAEPGSQGYLHHPEFDRWRREAPAIARSLMEAGHPAGFYLMAEAYRHDNQPFQALFPDEQGTAFGYMQVVRAAQGLPPYPDSMFTADEREQLAAVMHRFAKAAIATGPDEDELRLEMLAPLIGLPGQPDAGCE